MIQNVFRLRDQRAVPETVVPLSELPFGDLSHTRPSRSGSGYNVAELQIQARGAAR